MNGVTLVDWIERWSPVNYSTTFTATTVNRRDLGASGAEQWGLPAGATTVIVADNG